MNNLFLRLYLLIVATIIIVGFSIDQAWQHLEGDNKEKNHAESLLDIISLQLETLEHNQLNNYLQYINKNINHELSLIPYNSQMVQVVSEELNNNQILFIKNSNEVLGFKKIELHNQVLQLRMIQSSQNSHLKIIFIVLFYSLIALGIFYWIWPLSKDLNQLEEAVKRFDLQQWNSKVELTESSSIRHLANAYNALLDKIKLLVETQQAMSHSISHELRTPLARIRFSLQFAEESQDMTIIKEHINSISDDISEMNHLINELLNFSSLEKKSSIAKIEKGNINLLVENLLDKLTTKKLDKTIFFNQKINNNQVSCDSYLMERAIQNLIINAIKFSNKEIIITTRETNDDFEIVVEDDGIGIAESFKNIIFDSFVQLEHQHKGKGFGLGLAIVKRVMELHKGTVIVEQSSLGGAKFILCWPKN